MTIYAWARPRAFPALPAATPRYFDVAPRDGYDGYWAEAAIVEFAEAATNALRSRAASAGPLAAASCLK